MVKAPDLKKENYRFYISRLDQPYNQPVSLALTATSPNPKGLN